jgi:hypothetical protein
VPGLILMSVVGHCRQSCRKCVRRRRTLWQVAGLQNGKPRHSLSWISKRWFYIYIYSTDRVSQRYVWCREFPRRSRWLACSSQVAHLFYLHSWIYSTLKCVRYIWPKGVHPEGVYSETFGHTALTCENILLGLFFFVSWAVHFVNIYVKTNKCINYYSIY